MIKGQRGRGLSISSPSRADGLRQLPPAGYYAQHTWIIRFFANKSVVTRHRHKANNKRGALIIILLHPPLFPGASIFPFRLRVSYHTLSFWSPEMIGCNDSLGCSSSSCLVEEKKCASSWYFIRQHYAHIHHCTFSHWFFVRSFISEPEIVWWVDTA